MLNKRGSFFLFVFLAGMLSLSGCDQIKGAFDALVMPKEAAVPSGSQTSQGPDKVYGTVLAKVNNEVITLESFGGKIKDLEALSPEIKIDTLEAKKAYLNDLITQELIFQEAKARGIDKQRDVKEAIEEFRKGVMARQLILDETKGITVEPDEIETFYNRYRDDFASPQELRVGEIVVSSETTAKAILIEILQGANFSALAKERSISSSASSGGDAGFIKPGEKFDKFNEVISTLDVGEVSQIFQGPSGYYIVKVLEKRGGEVPTLTEAYDEIKTGLLQQKQAQRIQDLTDRLKASASIEIKETLL